MNCKLNKSRKNIRVLISVIIIFQDQTHLPALQGKLRNAAKSRLNRWMKPHKRNPALDAPEWLQKEWRTGVRADIADLLSHCNFNKEWATEDTVKS